MVYVFKNCFNCVSSLILFENKQLWILLFYSPCSRLRSCFPVVCSWSRADTCVCLHVRCSSQPSERSALAERQIWEMRCCWNPDPWPLTFPCICGAYDSDLNLLSPFEKLRLKKQTTPESTFFFFFFPFFFSEWKIPCFVVWEPSDNEAWYHSLQNHFHILLFFFLASHTCNVQS